MPKVIRENITTARGAAAQKLKKASESPHIDADILLAHILKKSREYLFTNADKFLTAKQLHRYNELVTRRQAGEPIAYLTGHKEFFKLDFLVTPEVLIPRPGTEILVEETLKLIKKYKKPLQVVELGVGSGAVSIALARNSNATISASDISPSALQVARKNARRLQAKVNFTRGSLLLPHIKKHIDILVANLPYLKLADSKKKRDPWGLRFEPAGALYSGRDGLDHYRKLIDELTERTQKPLFVLLEFDHRQIKQLLKYISKKLPEATTEIINDYQPLPRVLKVHL